MLLFHHAPTLMNMIFLFVFSDVYVYVSLSDERMCVGMF